MANHPLEVHNSKLGRMIGWFDRPWKIVAGIAGAAVVIIGIVTGCITIYDRFAEGTLVPIKPPQGDTRVIATPQVTLVADEDEEWDFLPFGPGLATPVYWENPRRNSCEVYRVSFSPKGKPFDTPPREYRAGAVESLPVNLKKPRSLGKGQRLIYRTDVHPPTAVEAGDTLSLEVAVIDPTLVKKSYRGTLTITLKNDKKVSVENVVVDVLRKPPPPISSLGDE